MSIQYNPVDPTSMTRQIADQIRQSILDGRLKADDRLPTEHELAKQFSVFTTDHSRGVEALGSGEPYPFKARADRWNIRQTADNAGGAGKTLPQWRA